MSDRKCLRELRVKLKLSLRSASDMSGIKIVRYGEIERGVVSINECSIELYKIVDLLLSRINKPYRTCSDSCCEVCELIDNKDYYDVLKSRHGKIGEYCVSCGMFTIDYDGDCFNSCY